MRRNGTIRPMAIDNEDDCMSVLHGKRRPNVSERRRHRREKLWRQDPRCCYCGTVTVLPPYGGKMKKMMPNYATIDHLRSRLNPARREPSRRFEIRTVLCCWKCNGERAAAEEAALGREKLSELARLGKERQGIKESPRAAKLREIMESTGIPKPQRKGRRIKRLCASFIRGEIGPEELTGVLRDESRPSGTDGWISVTVGAVK